MTSEEYKTAQELLVGQGRVLSFVDWNDFLGSIERADAIGPIMDPTLYREAVQTMYLIKKLAMQAQGMSLAFQELEKHLREERT